jgi:Mg-chelatase subunit ChlD
MNELVDHWEFFKPDWYLVMLGNECLSREILEIFSIARVLFSSKSLYPTKNRLVSLLSREKSSSLSSKEAAKISETSHQKQPMSDHVRIANIESVSQLPTILPREFLIYDTDIIFFKKLINRELTRLAFESPEEKTSSVSALVRGQEQEVNRAQKIYVLFDNSSSMSGERLNKFHASKAITLEYLRKAQPENPQIYFRSFTDKVSPLIRSEKTKDIKNIVKHVAHLHTEDCYQTEIGKAILKAVEDIRSDHRMVKAEILVITDGLGPIPKNLREILGEIKLHVILICGINIDQMLKLYPDRRAWDQAGARNKERQMPSFWGDYGTDAMPLSLPDPGETLEMLRRSKLTPGRNRMLRKMEVLLSLSQVYQIQEVADTFIPLPSMLGEKFNTFNPYELELITEYRKKLEQNGQQKFSIQAKAEIYQLVQFMIKYLTTLFSRKPSRDFQNKAKDIHEKIKLEIDHFVQIRKTLLKDPWFTSTMNSLTQQGEKMHGSQEREEMLLASGRERKGIQEALILLIRIIRRVGRCFHAVLRLPRSALKVLHDRLCTCLKKRRLKQLRNKFHTEFKNARNL